MNYANTERADGTLSAAQINVPTDVATARTVAAYLVSVPFYQRREIASQALALAGSQTVPVITLVQGIGLSPRIEDAAKMLSGQNQILLAMAQLGPNATTTDVLKYAESIGTGLPFAGDPNVGGSVPLASAVLAALPSFRDMDPSQSREVISFLSQLARNFDCTHQESSISATPMNGGLIDWVKKTFGKHPSVEVLPSDNASEAPVGSEANPVQLEEVTVTPESNKAQAPAAKSNWIADIGKALAQTGISANVPGVGQIAIGSGMDNPSWGFPGTASSLTGMSTAAQAQMNIALASLKNYASQTKQRQQEAKISGMQAARAEWASALISAPDETMEVLSVISPDFSDLKKAIRTMMSVLPAARDTGDINVLQSLGYAIKGAVTDGQLTQSVVASLMTGDPFTDAIFTNAPVDLSDSFGDNQSGAPHASDDLGLNSSDLGLDGNDQSFARGNQKKGM